ncbi:CLC_0170 family protein [Paenibacillus cymbidii]|uniref:CLC_0170 family protein n=1 Tax=Paenibacillus cymbidii TaxID=1639034 RepID=UPI0010804B8C|nr:CLC_0170 family protein [Paenibacillus cymbidii]
MFHHEYTSSYFNYAVPLWLVAGCLLLIESKGYERDDMPREMKLAQLLGWFNITLGVLLFIGNWAFKKWIWS